MDAFYSHLMWGLVFNGFSFPQGACSESQRCIPSGKVMTFLGGAKHLQEGRGLLLRAQPRHWAETLW